MNEERVCATCDEMVGTDHPAEWLCANDACGLWFHVGGTDTCPNCGSEGMA